MEVIITQKCPCSYVFKQQKVINIIPLPSQSIVTCIPGRGPKFHKSNDSKEELISTKVLTGDEPFKEISMYNSSSQKMSNFKLIACPKCGTVLHSEIAQTITKKES